MADRADTHELPLAERLIDQLIGMWLDTHLGILAATMGNDPACQKVVDRARHLHLACYDTQLTPRIVEELRRAGLLVKAVES